MIENEEFYNDNLEGLLKAILNKGKLQKDINKAGPLPPQRAKLTADFDDITVERTCRVTGVEYCFKITIDQFNLWQKGTLSQNAFPHLAPHQREIIQTGYTPAEWALIFDDPDWDKDGDKEEGPSATNPETGIQYGDLD